MGRMFHENRSSLDARKTLKSISTPPFSHIWCLANAVHSSHFLNGVIEMLLNSRNRITISRHSINRSTTPWSEINRVESHSQLHIVDILNVIESYAKMIFSIISRHSWALGKYSSSRQTARMYEWDYMKENRPRKIENRMRYDVWHACTWKLFTFSFHPTKCI